jgi:hypothetical protein
MKTKEEIQKAIKHHYEQIALLQAELEKEEDYNHVMEVVKELKIEYPINQID